MQITAIHKKAIDHYYNELTAYHPKVTHETAVGYRVTNTIFEDTRRAVLYQNNKPILEADLTQPKELTGVLDLFLSFYLPLKIPFKIITIMKR